MPDSTKLSEMWFKRAVSSYKKAIFAVKEPEIFMKTFAMTFNKLLKKHVKAC